MNRPLRERAECPGEAEPLSVVTLATLLGEFPHELRPFRL